MKEYEFQKSINVTINIRQEFGRNLEFISWIKRDGSGVYPLSAHPEFEDDTFFNLQRLSITNDTWIASEFNSYVVKIKK